MSAAKKIELRMNEGVGLLQTGAYLAAEEIFLQLCKIQHSDAHLWYLLGTAQSLLKKYNEAFKSFQNALTLNPKYAEAHNNLGTLLEQQDNLAEARIHYQKAVDCRPDYAKALYNLANTYSEQEDWASAIHYYIQALDSEPQYLNALNNLGTAYLQTDQIDLAREILEKARAIDADDSEILTNLGYVYFQGKALEPAIECYKTALHLGPRTAELYSNIGLLQQYLQNYEEAEKYFRLALESDPTFDKAENNLGLLQLAENNFRHGWENYWHRKSMRNKIRERYPPLPQDLTGVQILVKREQGLGDQLFFLRFVQELKARGASVTYLSEPRMVDILKRSDILDKLITEEHKNGFDFEIFLGDLPLFLMRNNISLVPDPFPLKPLADRVSEILRRLENAGPPPYIALTWKAGVKGFNQLSKTIDLQQFSILAGSQQGTYISVQRLPDKNDIAELSGFLGKPVLDFSDINDDLEDALACMTAVDHYLGVSNTNTHLRQSIGKKCLVLVPYPPDWRWMNRGSTSPWMPNCMIYRENIDGIWIEPTTQSA